eukprot:1185295-Prorocentrum_minimum.AAC.5
MPTPELLSALRWSRGRVGSTEGAGGAWLAVRGHGRQLRKFGSSRDRGAHAAHARYALGG